MRKEFLVPLTPEGLLKAASSSRYAVQHVVDVSALSDKAVAKTLDRFMSRLEADALAIEEGEVFDTLYSYLAKFGALSGGSKARLADVLALGLSKLGEAAGRMEGEAARAGSEAVRNAARMLAYLAQWLVQAAEKEAQQAAKKSAAKAAGRKKKKAASGDGAWTSVTQKENLLCALVQLLEVDLRKFWSNGNPEEEFLNLFVKIALQFLETAANVKSKQLKECLFALLAAVVTRYQQTFAVSSAVLELVFKHEHFVAPAAELLERIVQESPQSQFVGDVVREISRMDSNFADAAGTKNLAQFLVHVAERLPRHVLPFVSLLIPYLGNEAYVLRNGVVQALGHIVARGFGGEEGDDRTDHRDQLLQILEERLLDVGSYTRSKTLQTWSMLIREKAVPLKFIPTLLKAVVGRLEDRTAQVRRCALQLLGQMVENNPFSLNGTLRLSEFAEQLARVEQAIAAGKKQSEADEPEDKENQAGENQSGSQAGGQEDADAAAGEGEAVVDERLGKELQFFRDAVAFVRLVHEAVPTIIKLLGSTTVTDIQEAVRVLVTANEFKVEAAEDGAKQMLVLIWSKDAATKDAVIQAYQELYLTPPRSDNQQLEDLYVASNLVKLATSLTTTEMTSLEEMISVMAAKGLVSDETVEHLWSFFAGRLPNVTEAHAKGALVVLSMVAKQRPDVVKANLNLLVSVGLGVRWQADEEVAQYACVALQKLAACEGGHLRLPASHALFAQLVGVLTGASASVRRWFPAAEQALNAVYALCDTPDAVASDVLRHWAARLFGDAPALSSHLLAKFLFLVGHTAMKQMQHLEDIQTEMARRKARRETRGAAGGLEEDLGLQATDDTEEYIQCVTEQHLVCGNLLGKFSALIVTVCKNDQQLVEDPILRSAAVVSLCKYMCVSAKFCEEHLRLLFTLLERAPEPWVRSDIVIALGDLASRFPNQVGAWTPKIYARLRDEDAGVRKNTLMVLSHLILNEMVRVKGQISEIALCIVDSDKRIADLARLFFNELNSKGNCLYSIYNILPDMISNLSSSGVPSDVFRRVMRYLFGFLEKDKQIESLVDRLCKQRLKGATDVAHAADIAYCLSLLNYSEKAVKKLADNFKCYADKLVHESVHTAFLAVLQKCKKSKAPREDIEELEQRIAAAHSGEGLETLVSESEAESEAEEAPKRQRKKPTRKRATRKRAKKVVEEDEEEEGTWQADADDDE